MIELGDPVLAEVIRILKMNDDQIADAARSELLKRMNRIFDRYRRFKGHWCIDVDPDEGTESIEELLDLLSDCYEELRSD